MYKFSLVKRFFRSFYRGAQGFIEDDCYSQATALSYYTLLSIVPILAVAFGIAKGFGFEKNLETQILETFYQQQEFAEKLISFARSTLEHAHGTLIAGAGVFMLFWSALGLLGSFEKALNIIWKAPTIRSIPKRITDYLPVLIFCPVYIVAFSSLAFILISSLQAFSLGTGLYPLLKPLIHLLYYGLLLILTWALLGGLYIYMPNKTVPWGACILASFFSALMFQIIQWAFIHLQVFLTSYNAIYGSFAAIPLFLIWLQTSWLIILAGAEVAQHHASSGHLGVDIHYTKASERELILLIMMACCKAFHERQPLYDTAGLASTFHMPLLETSKLTAKCLQSQLLVEGVERAGQRCLVPAGDPDRITIDEILKTVDRSRDTYSEVAVTPELTQASEAIRQWEEAQHTHPANVTLKSIYIPN